MYLDELIRKYNREIQEMVEELSKNQHFSQDDVRKLFTKKIDKYYTLTEMNRITIGTVEQVEFLCGCQYGHNFRKILEGKTCNTHVSTDLVEHYRK